MEKIKIYLHSENCKEPEIIEIDESATVKEIIIKHHEKKNPDGSFDEEYKIFIEDEDGCRDPTHNNKDCGIDHKSRVHCHRCEKIKLALEYNNVRKEVEVAPSYTGEKILSLVPGLFGISPNDVAGLRLKTDATHYMESTEHIGTLVQYPHCSIGLQLVSKVNVQG